MDAKLEKRLQYYNLVWLMAAFCLLMITSLDEEPYFAVSVIVGVVFSLILLLKGAKKRISILFLFTYLVFWALTKFWPLAVFHLLA